MKRSDILENPEYKFVVFCLLIAICLNIYFSRLGLFNSLLEHFAFRQTQTAISVWYYLKEGFTLNYLTPVFGAPWSIPFEFPTYQLITAVLSKLTPIPLEPAGRLVSLVFFYLALYYIYRILSLYFDKILSLIPIVLMLVCPQYIYWSRTFMIESTALFFCISHLYYLLKLKHAFSYNILILCVLFGMLGCLTKITTYVVVMTPAGLYFLGSLISDIRSGKFKIIYWSLLLSPVFISFVAAIAWTAHADHLKSLNPLAQTLASNGGAQKGWIFGTLQQRLSLANWSRIVLWTIQYGTGSLSVCMLMPLWGIWASKKDRLFIGLSLCGFLSGPLIFFNLYYIHYYYHYGNIFFLVIAIGAVIIAVADKPEFPVIIRRSAVWCAMPVVAAVMIYAYVASDYYKVQNTNVSIAPQISCLRNNFRDTDILLIYDNDWSPVLPYYLGRKAIMNPQNYPPDHPLMLSSLDLTGKDNIVAIIKNDYSQAFAEVVQKVFGMRFLPAFPGIYIREDRYADMRQACSGG